MGSELTQLIESLESIPRDRTPASFAEFENILEQIMALKDPGCIGPLVLMLEDDESLDELMFSVVHTIEMFKDNVYTDRILHALPALVRKSPRWARILHMRILNSEPTRAEYVERYRRGKSDEKAAARDVLAGVREWRPEFTDRVNAILSINPS